MATDTGVDAVGHAISWAIARSFLCRQLPQERHHCRLICWRQPNARLLRVSFSCSQPVRTLKQYAHIVIVAMAAAIALPTGHSVGNAWSMLLRTLTVSTVTSKVSTPDFSESHFLFTTGTYAQAAIRSYRDRDAESSEPVLEGNGTQ